MKNRLHILSGLSLAGLMMIAGACSKSDSTAPVVETPAVSVHYAVSSGCSLVSTHSDSVNMGTVEFDNTTNSIQIVPVQIAVKMTATSDSLVKMYSFNGTWRNTDGSVTPNTDEQNDPTTAAMTIGAVSNIPPHGKFSTRLMGTVPDLVPATYAFAIIPDSTKAKSVAGQSATVTVGASTFSLKIGNSCP